MRINPVQAVLASVAIFSTAVLAEAIRPRELLASTQVAPDLDKIIPRDCGGWHLVPRVRKTVLPGQLTRRRSALDNQSTDRGKGTTVRANYLLYEGRRSCCDRRI